MSEPPSSADEAIARELGPGEQLLWAGRPPCGVMFRWIDVFFIPFGLMVIGFGVFGLGVALNNPGQGNLIAAPFVLGIPLTMGLYIAFGRIWIDARIRRGMRYAVTADRVVIVYRWLGARLSSHALRQIPEVRLVEFRDGSGRINFGIPLPWAYQTDPFRPTSFAGSELVLGSGVRQVYEIIREAQRAALRPTDPQSGKAAAEQRA